MNDVLNTTFPIVIRSLQNELVYDVFHDVNAVIASMVVSDSYAIVEDY